ncbi:MAG: calcium/sodium antiporter [Bacteroidales bacterium]|nr:calcium/sodium antiporter [Bacteroidales bacterium]
MLLNLLFVVVGIALVLFCADKMTDGAVALATKFKIPEMVIGLTIVAIGTSAPELVVSLVSALNDSPNIAVGNVVGSNIFNTLMIVGVTALVCPMVISKSTVKKDIPFAVVGSAMLFWFAFDLSIERWEAAVLFAGFIAFMIYTISEGKKGNVDNTGETDDSVKQMPIWKSLLFVVLGIAGLIYGSDLFVDNAKAIALALGVSEAVVGLTVVACGTSLPELATSIVAARKGQSALAIGNVLGSNVFNIFMIVGITGLICPMRGLEITNLDLGMLLGSIFALWLFSYTKYKIERWEGAVLTLSIVAYMTWLVYNAMAGAAA